MPRRRNPNARKGPLSRREKELLEAVDPKADIGQAARALGPVLRRSTKSLRGAIRDARERLAERAKSYADAHHTAVIGALEDREWDVAAKHSMQALEKLSFDGQRVIEAPAQGSDNRVAVQIVLPAPLGGTRDPKALPANVQIAEIEAEANQDG